MAKRNWGQGRVGGGIEGGGQGEGAIRKAEDE